MVRAEEILGMHIRKCFSPFWRQHGRRQQDFLKYIRQRLFDRSFGENPTGIRLSNETSIAAHVRRNDREALRHGFEHHQTARLRSGRMNQNTAGCVKGTHIQLRPHGANRPTVFLAGLTKIRRNFSFPDDNDFRLNAASANIYLGTGRQESIQAFPSKIGPYEKDS